MLKAFFFFLLFVLSLIFVIASGAIFLGLVYFSAEQYVFNFDPSYVYIYAESFERMLVSVAFYLVLSGTCAVLGSKIMGWSVYLK